MGIPTSSTTLTLLLIGGAILTLGSYAYFLPRVFPGQPVSALWFGIEDPLRTAYYVSIVLAAIAFVVLSVWMLSRAPSDTTPPQRQAENSALGWFFAGAVMWSVTLWIWGAGMRGDWEPLLVIMAKASVILSLVMTTYGAFRLLFELGRPWHSQHPTRASVPWWVLVSTTYVLWHVGVLDNIGWSVAFLRYSQ